MKPISEHHVLVQQCQISNSVTSWLIFTFISVTGAPEKSAAEVGSKRKVADSDKKEDDEDEDDDDEDEEEEEDEEEKAPQKISKR